MDLADVAAKIDVDTTAVCITNPNNPTATVLSFTELESFVYNVPADVVVIVDEVAEPTPESVLDHMKALGN